MMLERLIGPPDRAKPTPGWDVGFGRADTAADCRQDRSAKDELPQWARHTSPRLVGIVNAHRQTFPGIALPRDIQAALAAEWSRI